VIFNDKAHGAVTGKETKDDFQLHLEHGKPMLFGKENEKGLRLNGFKLEVVTPGENGIEESDILIHDAHQMDTAIHNMLIRMSPPHFPMALGIIRAVKAPTYDELVENQYRQSVEKASFTNVSELLRSGNIWEVK
jgi:2-oxoglutarate ferredoxin oxidoreductase subunit beta